jgi:hypothetical protein
MNDYTLSFSPRCKSERVDSHPNGQENDLVALTKFHRQLEDYYRLDPEDVKLAYERRSGQFYAAAVTKTRVVTISDQGPFGTRLRGARFVVVVFVVIGAPRGSR